MSYLCTICELEYDTPEEADTCCVLCDYCGLYYYEWEINENGYCEDCQEWYEEEDEDQKNKS